MQIINRICLATLFLLTLNLTAQDDGPPPNMGDTGDPCGDVEYPVADPGPDGGCADYADCNGNGAYDLGEPCFEGQPMDEDTDANENIVGFCRGNRSILYAVGNRHGDGALRRAKHLNRLLRALNRDLVEHNRIGLGGQIRCDDGHQTTETILVIR